MPITSNPLSSLFATIFTIGNDDVKKNINFQYCCSFMQLDDSYKIYLRRQYKQIFDYVEGAIASSSSSASSTSSSLERIGWIVVTQRPGELTQNGKHMLVSEFCERLHFYGICVMLVTYLHQQIQYNEKMSILIYHSFLMFIYLSCVFSKAVLMSYFDMTKCLVTSCAACIIGDILLILSANWRSSALTLFGLLVVGISIGCSKPIIMRIGPDQFNKEESIDMVYFLKVFHNTVSAAAIIASFCYPLLRSYLTCSNGISCYMQIYLVGQIALIISLVSWIMFRKNWKDDVVQREQPVVTVMLCAHNAYLIWQKEQILLKRKPLEDFLDYSLELYEEEFITEIKIFRKLLYLYMSLPIFWSLCYQQCSSWVLQAVKMDGDFDIFIVRPEHMQLCCILIGMYINEKLYKHIHQFLNTLHITHHLQRVTLAIALAALAFLLAAFLEYNLDKLNKPILKHAQTLGTDEAELRIYNVMPCRYKFDLGDPESIFKLRNLHIWSHIFYNFDSPYSYILTAVSLDVHCPKIKSEVSITPGRLSSYFIAYDKILEFEETEGNDTSIVHVLFNGKMEEQYSLRIRNDENEKIFATDVAYESLYDAAVLKIKMQFGTYYFDMEGIRVSKKFKADKGISYTILIEGSKKKGFYSAIIGWVISDEANDSETKDMLILYQIPQIFIMKLAESIFLNEGITFALDHIPSSLSSVVHFLWILNVGTGQFLIISLMILFNFESFVYWYLSFAVIIFINMLVFAYFAIKYNDFFHAAKEAKRLQNMSAKELHALAKKKKAENKFNKINKYRNQ